MSELDRLRPVGFPETDHLAFELSRVWRSTGSGSTPTATSPDDTCYLAALRVALAARAEHVAQAAVEVAAVVGLPAFASCDDHSRRRRGPSATTAAVAHGRWQCTEAACGRGDRGAEHSNRIARMRAPRIASDERRPATRLLEFVERDPKVVRLGDARSEAIEFVGAEARPVVNEDRLQDRRVIEHGVADLAGADERRDKDRKSVV